MTINEKIREYMKRTLVNSPVKYSERMDATLRLTLLKNWIKKYKTHPYFESRLELYQYVSQMVGNNTRISYLEFGVYKGASLLNWVKSNSNEKSEFIGFDSFEGLPEDWINISGITKRGAYSAAGEIPSIQDNRVNFLKGWFQSTLPLFLDRFSSDKQIIIHCDADIYSSTMYVLCKMDSTIRAGTIIIFDDFSSMLHDFRALEDYTNSFQREYKVLGASGQTYYEQVAILFTK